MHAHGSVPWKARGKFVKTLEIAFKVHLINIKTKLSLEQNFLQTYVKNFTSK